MDTTDIKDKLNNLRLVMKAKAKSKYGKGKRKQKVAVRTKGGKVVMETRTVGEKEEPKNPIEPAGKKKGGERPSFDIYNLPASKKEKDFDMSPARASKPVGKKKGGANEKAIQLALAKYDFLHDSIHKYSESSLHSILTNYKVNPNPLPKELPSKIKELAKETNPHVEISTKDVINHINQNLDALIAQSQPFKKLGTPADKKKGGAKPKPKTKPVKIEKPIPKNIKPVEMKLKKKEMKI